MEQRVVQCQQIIDIPHGVTESLGSYQIRFNQISHILIFIIKQK